MIWYLAAGFIGFIIGIAVTIGVFCWCVRNVNKVEKCVNW